MAQNSTSEPVYRDAASETSTLATSPQVGGPSTVRTNGPGTPARTPLPAGHPATADRAAGGVSDAPLLAELCGEAPDAPPSVWFMRQAGRSLPEYRALREGISMLDACVHPEMVAEITAQPVRRHRVDAGIFFSDIVVPARLAGLGVEIRPGVGPVFEHPIRTEADVESGHSRLVSSGLGKHLAARQAGAPLASWDEPLQLLSVPIGAELPGLYARAAVLCSGLIPTRVDDDFSLNYGDITREFAEVLVAKLMG